MDEFDESNDELVVLGRQGQSNLCVVWCGSVYPRYVLFSVAIKLT